MITHRNSVLASASLLALLIVEPALAFQQEAPIPLADTVFTRSAGDVTLKAGSITDVMLGLSTPALGAATATSLTASGLVQAGTTLGISTDVLLNRDSANVLALRNGAAAQTLRVYNSYTNSTNGEWGAMVWSSNVLSIGSNKNGTGNNRDVAIMRGGVEQMRFTNGNIIIGGTNVYSVSGSSPTFQVQNTAAASVGQFTFNSGASISSQYQMGRSRGSTLGDFTAVQSGDRLGIFNFGGSDGTSLQPSVQILAWADGTISAGVVPGRIEFSTANSSGAMKRAVAINSSQMTAFGTNVQFDATYPSLKRSSTTLQVRLADDSSFAPIQGKLTTDTNYTAGVVVTTGYITLYDATGTPYKVNACTGC
jgi:hypothetical protein